MRERIKFKPGSNSETRKNSVVRGQRDEYVFRARPGQQLTVHISSIEDNAGFEIHVHETDSRAAFLGSKLTSAASLTAPRTATARGMAPTGTPITRTGSKGKGPRWTRGAPSYLASAAVSASERRGSEARRRRGRHGRPPNPRGSPRRPHRRDRPLGPRR